MAGTKGGPAVPPDPGSQFGWTGIKTERYTRWNGKMADRKGILRSMVKESVKHDMRSIGVIILIILAWVFSVLFTVLPAGMGQMSLVMDPDAAASSEMGRFMDDTDPGKQGVDISLHMVIMNDSVAEFDLAGLNPTNMTTFSLSGIPSGWSAYVNQSGVQGAASLVVIPPADVMPWETAMVTVEAKTPSENGKRKDKFTTITTITDDPMMTFMRFGLTMDFEKPVVEGDAGEKVEVKFNITNTGTMADEYNITILSKPSGWKVMAKVNGTPWEMHTLVEGIPGVHLDVYSIKYKYITVPVEAGESLPCTFEITTTDTSATSNIISISGNSNNDPMVFGTYGISVNLKGTQKVDLTSTIIFNQVMGLQFLWALLMAAVVGSKAIATDLSQKSYNLYFSRPMTKGDYIIGKFGTSGILLSMVTMVPTLVTYLLLILLSDVDKTYVIDHLWVWGSIIGQSLIVIITFASLSIALSSLTSRRFYAAASLVVIYLVTTLMAQITVFGFNLDYGWLISIQNNFDILGRTLFDMDISYINFPWYYAAFVMVPLWVLSMLLVWVKVEKTELSE